MSVTDEIKAKLDIVNYVQQFVPLKKAGRYYKACCPFHAEKTPSFVVNPDNQTWRCFGACAEGGDVLSFAMKQNGWTFSEALQELGRQVGIETRQLSPEQKQQHDRMDHLRGLLKITAELYHDYLMNTVEGEGARRYAVEKRGFSNETLTKFLIGSAPPGWDGLLRELKHYGYSEDDMLQAGVIVRNDKGRLFDRFRNRLMIPIRDDRGRIVGFGARALDADDNPKYLNSPQSVMFDKSRTLFGLDTAKRAIRDSETAIIVEGYMDAISAQQAGFMNVVAQMGTALTEAQLKLIAPRYAKKIILALDSDAAGQNATMRSLEVARQTLQADYAGRMSVDIRILQNPDAKDPDDLIRESPDRWRGMVENAMPVTDYVIMVETGHLSAQASIQEREAVARRVLPLLVASENDLYRQDSIQKLAVKLHIPERDLLQWAQTQRGSSPTQSPSVDEPPDYPASHYDDADAPPELDDYAYPDGEADAGHVLHGAASEPSTRRARSASPQVQPPRSERAALEAYCLRGLILNPEMWYSINGKFRELAGTQQDLLRGPLAELGIEDFFQAEYREVMRVLRDAISQDDTDVITYCRTEMNAALTADFERLLAHELDGLQERLKRRFMGDAASSWKQHERRVVAYVDPALELLEKALRLRLGRLQRESQEIQFLQLEAQLDAQANTQNAHDSQQSQVLFLAMLLHKAMRLLDAEIARCRTGLL